MLAYSRHPGVESRPLLKEQVIGFVSQEVRHASCHISYNKVIADSYSHDMDGISGRVKRLLSFTERYRTFSDQKVNCLAITCSLEHLTATLAELLLNTTAGTEALRNAAPSHRALWVYHAIEETEH